MTNTPDSDPTGDMPPSLGGGGTTERYRVALRGTSDHAAGDEIGPYKLLTQIGEGGFGEVWLAERRQPFVQRVALKLIKPGMDSRSVVARFEQERQALAVMNHPNIAKVLDGGLTPQGRPYFAMEYVKGEPITVYADRNRLTIRQRLELFVSICDAVQHAHMKGIIHRDIKPSNILVAPGGEGHAPVVKVIDFGVAKAISHTLTERSIFTERGQLIGTPEYMSPEQAEMGATDIDTRTDVYSLGVVLYELLSGTLPFDPKTLRAAGLAEIQRIIREVDAPRPSTRLSTADDRTGADIARARQADRERIAGELRRELEWIPLKALRKDRTRRYASAESLGADVRRYLEGKPLEAAPESRGYLIRKFVRRNRVQVSAAAAVAVALVAGAVATGLALTRALAAEAELRTQLVETQRAKDAEKDRADQLKKVSDFQSGMLAQIDTTTAGVELMKDVRERFAEALEKAGVPEAERAARTKTVVDLLVRVNATDAAAAMIDRTILKPAIKTIDEHFKDDPATDASLRQALAYIYFTIGRYEDAYPLQESALATRRRTLGEEHPDTLYSISSMGSLLWAQGRLAEAEPYLREALEKRRRTLGEEHPQTLYSISSMGSLLWAQGRLAEAEPYLRDALEKRRRTLGEEHPQTLYSISSMGSLLETQGRPAEAEPFYREALEKRRRTLGEEHPDTLGSISDMGSRLQHQGRLAEAEPYLREALEKRRRTLGEEHPDTLGSISDMGSLLEAQGRLAEAEPYLREALEKRRRTLGEEHPDTLGSISDMGSRLQRQGRLAEAEPYLRDALEKRRRTLGEEHPQTLYSISDMGSLLLAQGRLAEAEPYLRDALEKIRRTLGEEHPQTLYSISSMGSLLWAQGRLSEAESFYRDALEKTRRTLGEEHPDTLGSISKVGSLLQAQGRLAEAESFYREALEKYRRTLGEEHPQTLFSISDMGSLLQTQGRLAEAEPYLRDALEKIRRTLGEEHPQTLYSISSMGSLLLAQGRLAEAEPYLRDALEKIRRTLGEEHPNTLLSVSRMLRLRVAQSQAREALDLGAPYEPAARKAFTGGYARRLADFLESLGRARAGLGYDSERFTLAEANLLEAHAIYLVAKDRGPTHKDTLGCVQALVDLYAAWDKAEPGKGSGDKAAEWKAKLDAANAASSTAPSTEKK